MSDSVCRLCGILVPVVVVAHDHHFPQKYWWPCVEVFVILRLIEISVRLEIILVGCRMESRVRGKEVRGFHVAHEYGTN